MRKCKYKAVLFDLDGTLLDTRRGVESAVKRTICDLNLKMLEEENISLFVGPPMQDSFEKYYGMNKGEALQAANLFRKNYRQFSLFEADMYPGIPDLLDNLKKSGTRVAVATNKSHDNARAILDYYGIAEKCEYVMGSDLGGKLKKEDIIKVCLQKLSVKSSEAVFIGDSEYDFMGAQKAGIDFIAVTYGFDFTDKTDFSRIVPVMICKNVNQIDEFLFGISNGMMV